MTEQHPTRQERVSQVVNTYTEGFPSASRSLATRSEDGDVILVTGTTGSLGCYLLATLLVLSPTVRRVYALNRASKIGLKDRQCMSLTDRGLDGDLVDCSKLVLLVGDITKPMMGLLPDVYTEVSSFAVLEILELTLCSRYTSLSPI